jgi:hypothetical protein
LKLTGSPRRCSRSAGFPLGARPVSSPSSAATGPAAEPPQINAKDVKPTP